MTNDWTTIVLTGFLAIAPLAEGLSAQPATNPGVQVRRIESVNPFALDKPVKPIRAKTMDGGNFNTRSLKEKVVVLNFWFTGCAPCVKEMPLLNELVGRFAGKNVGFYAITHDSTEVVNAFLQKKEFRFRHIVNARPLMDQLGVKTFPVTVIMDQKGMVRYSQVHSLSDVDELTKLIEDILQ